MNHRIRSILQRTLARILRVLAPATGRHREHPLAQAGPRTTSGRRLLVRAAAPPWVRPEPHRARARTLPPPDGDGPALDGASPLVRPYLLAHERLATLEVAA
ncbi:hypothetical protein LHJ74_05765 [Streptomyces sp. N2-109]|uniref:Secreted protein n=1 Tax=Streptomyces gossypii TaxID=2883101 RepID=A0ABT2JNP0_9ACTN|nr:hypothetical protein [Streptomyces gossypii]MCT2589441.1 hypothetical protein [Streptomyces gossypii]